MIIQDKITNQLDRPEQIMLLYHLNWGFPLLSADTQLEMDIISTTMRDSGQASQIDQWNHFTEPVPGYREVVYFHDLKSDEKGRVGYKLRNESLGIEVMVNWKKEQLPYLTQWKMMGQSEYVLGLEPGNCYPMGRIEERENGRSSFLQPGEDKEARLNIIFNEIKSYL